MTWKIVCGLLRLTNMTPHRHSGLKDCRNDEGCFMGYRGKSKAKSFTVYHHIAGWVKILQFGGTVPFFEDPGTQTWSCPNARNGVKIELKRIK